ncbi:O-methyltransferase [Nocardia sp. SYP-A9097]|uniref:O-methyltransferase n=1 Tax=Nocardia sp. SYP-A9097 TaxID=2663237 RepID=UPI00129B44B7|nr:class I SAM-dependent methyltransferase [Nocardia sp. SYP-A9097]MRH92594.1 O-methyltransferase [Nocardia sp. SYP-A9097]
MAGKGITKTVWGHGRQLASIGRFLVGFRTFNRTGQVGDGREAAARNYVLANASAGDPDSVLVTMDEFARTRSMLVNVGDEKGLLLDAAVRKAEPKLALELGTYCGYSAVRIGRLLPSGARLVSVEFSAANAEVARAIIAHAGLADQVSVVVGTIGDGGETMHRLALDHGFDSGAVDLIFLDHAKAAYLADLKTILAAGWLHTGTLVVADNVRVPGVPDYLAYMKAQEGTTWRTAEHDTHVEYQSIVKDLVLESEYLG